MATNKIHHFRLRNGQVFGLGPRGLGFRVSIVTTRDSGKHIRASIFSTISG